MRKILLLICLTTLIAASCKKDETDPDADHSDAGIVNVLKDGSGFQQVYNATGAEINLSDFSVESNNNLNIVHYTIFRSQQDNFNRYIRETKNLTTGETVPLPQYAFDVKDYSPTSIAGYEKLTKVVFEGFRPYSNFFAYGTYRQGNISTYNYHVKIGGDISAEVSIANPLGFPELGFYYPVLDVTVGQSYYGLGVSNPSYLYRVANLTAGPFNNGTSKTLVKTMLESRLKSSNNGSAMQFDISTNSVIAYEKDLGDALYRKKTGEVLFNTSLTHPKITRHYSSDGKILVLLVEETEEYKFWAVSYNFSTNTLTKLFDKTSLDYGAAGSDVDCDEHGNLYYTGFANNGQNKVGISIYKKDPAGVNTLIGADNFLKFGEVIKLKVLYGKVYFALRGKITGSSDWQLSIIKQN